MGAVVNHGKGGYQYMGNGNGYGKGMWNKGGRKGFSARFCANAGKGMT